MTYVDENGVAIATESVLNGQSAEALEIEKDGYWFVGWYEDSSNSAEFAFNTSIAGNTTVYGWYIEKNLTASEYEITLDYGNGTTETVSTMNGAVWTLPTDGILGWWVSATNKPGELTYKYEMGTAFTSYTTLFAVYDGIGASVTGSGITWDASRAGANVSITITDENEETVLTANPSSSSGSYTSSDFAALGTGTYTVTVGDDTLTYVVNGLTRVSLSDTSVVLNGEGRVLSFAPVENAASYEITVSDGTRTVTENLGSRTYYNFSDWDMTKDGITFTVTAYADGYVSSVSDAYNYLLALDKVSIDVDGENVVWTRVENALEYEVTIYGRDDVVVESFYTTDTSYSLKYFDAGTYTVTVQPVTSGYWSEETKYSGYAKSTLASPVITSITEYSVSWSQVTGAISYVVSVNGNEYSVEEGTTLYFTDSDVSIDTGLNSYEIAVKAVETNGNDSSYSDYVTATNGAFSSAVSYEKNTVSWNYDISATSYVISVNGGAKTYPADGTNSQEIELTKVGDNDIVVTAYSGSEAIGQASLSVYAYSVTLDGNGLDTDKDVVYVAQGDTLKLGGVSGSILDHAEFIGWYTQADYTEGQSDSYEGKGSEVLDGSTFTGNRNTYVYAYWSYEYVNVTLVVGMGLVEDDGAKVDTITVPVKYNTSTTALPVPTPNNEEDVFDGWFTESNGKGTRYTEADGVFSATFGGEETLYAYYLAVLYYSKTTYNGETVYSVSAGSTISSRTELTIPAHYTVDGVEYNLILNSNAFENCTSLVKIDIPDTMRYIYVVNNGYDTGSGVFSGCGALKEVNVYETGEAKEDESFEIFYYSYDGVLFHKTEGTSLEVLYYPQAKADQNYVIPEAVYNEDEYATTGAVYYVTAIPVNVFKDKAFETVTVSSSVTEVAVSAFRSSKLTTVTFAEGGNGSFTIADGAFQKCTRLESVTIPARYSSFNVYAFSECDALVNVYVGNGSTYYSSDNGILLSADGYTIVYFPCGRGGDVVTRDLYAAAYKIGEYAFAENTKITSVTISNNITEIGKGAFQNCTSMVSLTFEADGQGNLTIESDAFYNCSLIAEVRLPSNLTTLKKDAFAACTQLVYVYFDARQNTQTSSLNFEENAFGESNYITTLELGPNVPTISNLVQIFDGGKLEEVIVDSGNTNYKSDTNGAVYDGEGKTILYYPIGKSVGECTLLDSLETINYGVLNNRVNITKITLGASVSSIADQAFTGCSYLTEIDVDSNNQYYASVDGVLYKSENGVPTTLVYCPVLNTVTELEVPDTVTSTTAYAFAENSTVTKVEFKATTSFDLVAYTFYNATALKTVVIPGCITEIKQYTFYGCTSLLGDLSTNGTTALPESLTTVGACAFYGCTKFAATIPAGVTTIGDYAFYNCWYDGSAARAPLTFACVEVSSDEGSDTEDLHATAYASATSLTIGEYAFAGTQCVTSITIPKIVTSVGAHAFENCGTATCEIIFETEYSLTSLPDYMFYNSSAKSVTIPDATTSLGSYSLASMTVMTKIEIPESVNVIGDYAFSSSALTSVEIPEGVQSVGVYAFSSTSLTSVEIPASVTSIGNYAFYGCTKLASVAFKEDSGDDADSESTGTTLEIGAYAFSSDTALTSIQIPARVTTLGTYMFTDCTALTTVTFADGSQVTSIPNNMFQNCTSLSSINLPSGLTSIGYAAFSTCASLSSMTIPEGVTSIGSSSFVNCDALSSITIPASVKTIEEQAFNECDALASVTFAEGSNLESIGSTAFGACLSLSVFAFPESTARSIALGDRLFCDAGGSAPHLSKLYLSSSVTDLGGALGGGVVIDKIEVAGGSQYYEADENERILYSKDRKAIVFVFGEGLLENINLPDYLERIEDYAFQNQTLLTEVTFPSTVTYVGAYAFAGCTSLEKVDFAGAGTGTNLTLGEHIFDGCTALSDVTLRDGLAAIPDYAFNECGALQYMDVPSTVWAVGDSAFKNTGLVSINITGVTDVDFRAFEFCYSLETVTFGSRLTNIGEQAFYNCSSLKIETLPEGVTELPSQLFQGCSSIERFTIPSTVTVIEDLVFRDCTSLTRMVIPEGVTEINYQTFYQCSSLAEIVLPSTVKTIGQNAFQSTAIEELVIPDGCTEIQEYAFQTCKSLRYVIISDSVTSIGMNAFNQDSALESVYTGGARSIGQNAFLGCSSLAGVQFSPYLETIGTQAFQNCTSLVSVEFGTYLRSIGNMAFMGCTSLTSVTISKGLESIGQQAFQNDTKIEYIVIPSTVTSVGANAFNNSGVSGVKYPIYVDNTANVVNEWPSTNPVWNNNAGTVYYYSSGEPTMKADGTGYDGNFWHYDDDHEIAVWTFEYETYSVTEGGFVLYTEEGGIAYVCLYDEESQTSTLYAVSECVSDTDGYTVTLSDGSSYTVVLDKDSSTAMVTAVETSGGDVDN